MALFSVEDKASRVELFEDRYELEPHSPSESQSSWSTEQSGITSGFASRDLQNSFADANQALQTPQTPPT